MKTRLNNIRGALGAASQRAGLSGERLAGLSFDNKTPPGTRREAFGLWKFYASLTRQGIIDPIAVADHMQGKVDQLQAELDELRSAIEAAEQRAQSLEQQLSQQPTTEALQTAALAQKEATDRRILELTSRVEHESGKNTDLESEVQDLTSQIGTLEIQLNEAVAQSNQAGKEVTDKESQLQSKQLKIENFESKIKGLTQELEKFRNTKEAAEKSITELIRRRDEQDAINVNLHTSLQQARVELAAIDKINRDLDAEVGSLKKERDQARHELSNANHALTVAREKLDQFQELTSFTERIDPAVIKAWLLIFNRMNNEIEDLGEKREAFFQFYVVVDLLLRLEDPQKIYAKLNELFPDLMAGSIKQIAEPEEEVPELDLEDIKTRPIRNQLRLLARQSLNQNNREELIQHLYKKHLEEVRQHRNDADKIAANGANLVWKHWLQGELIYFTQNPDDLQSYTLHLSSLASATDDLKIIIEDPEEDIETKNTARRILNDLKPSEKKPPEKKPRFWERDFWRRREK